VNEELPQIYLWQHRAETQPSKEHEHEQLIIMREFVRAALGDDLLSRTLVA